MAANSNLHVFLPYNVSSSSSAKNSPASIPNGFKSQEVLRPWNKMFAKKKTNSVFPSNEKHLMSNCPPLEKPESNVHGAGLSCASSFQSLSVCATSNSSFENRQTLPKVAASNLLSQSNSVLSNKKHSVNKEKKSPKSSLSMNGGDATCSGSILSENCYSKCRKSPKSQPDSCNGDSLLNQSEDDGMTFSRIIGFHGNNDNSCLPSTIRNPNKAICTIDAKSSQILTANEMACALFGYDRADMIRKRLIDLIQLKKKDEKTLMESYLEPNGQIISITGKVVEAVDKNGLVLPVSLWMKRLDYNKKSRCLVAMEPAHRLVCSMFFDMKGTILSCDDKLSYLYGFTDSEDMIGMNINQLIPGFQLPNSGYRISKNVKKQRATGRSLDGSVFPLSIHVQSVNITSSGEEEEEEEEDGGRKRRVEDRKNKSCCRKSSFSTKSDYVFEAIICVFSNITGLITFFPDGTIHSVNHHFALMLFGYSNLELIGKNVSVLIPDFYSIVSSLNLQKDKIPPISPVNSSVTRSSIGEIFSPAKIKKKAAKLHCPDLMSVTEKRRFSDVTSDPRTASKEWQNHLPELKPKGSSTPYRMSTHLKLNEITHNSNEDLKMPFEKQLKSMRPIPFDPQYSDIESCSEDEEHNLQPIKALPNSSNPHMDTTSSQSNQSPSNPTNSNSQTMPSETNTIESLETASKNRKLSFAEDSSGKNSNSRNGFCSKEEFSSSGNSKTILGNKPSSETGSNSKDSSSFTKDQTKESQTFNSSSSSSPVTSSPKDKDLNFSRTSDSIIRLEPELALIDAKMEALCVDCNSSLTGYSSAETEDEDSETEKKNHFRMTNSSTNLVPPNNLRFNPDQNLVPPEKICGACVPKIIPKEELGVGSNPKATTTAITACLYSSSSSPTAIKDGLKIVPSPKKKFSEKSKIERMIASPETLDSDEDSFEFLEREIEKTCQKKEMLNGEAHHFLDELDSSLELEEEGHDDKNLFIQTTPLNNINSLIKDDVGNLFLKSSSPKKINVTPETEQAPEVESSLDVILGSSGAFKKLLRHNYRKEALQNSLLQKQTHNDNVCMLDGEDGTVQENLSALDENTDGDFAGLCQHKDGSMININFSVNPMHLESGELMFCLWLSQDIDKNSLHNFTIDFPKSSNENSINVSDPQVHSSLTPEGIKTADRAEESYPPCKAFDRNYQNLRTIGHGAFGFVVESLEESTKLEVIVKYILRSKILSENWRDDPSLGRIPLEVSLLSQLSHPNIVQVLNVFNSQDYVLMVMEKHGSGMDLFEFIEHKPTMDEGLHSYIFRQLVSAIAYLHRCGIVHRDIKDENIIVNEHFHIKLIDFGSAAYMEEGKMFATFCGTVEYCSPEVLMGNGYDGPELEVWSMGVTLYTLVYGENPFFTVDDILACNFKPPFQVSEYLTDLLCWMLLPDPADRITVEELETDAWVFQAIDMTQYSWQEIMALPDGPTVPDYEVIYEDDSSLYEDKTDMLIPSSSSVHSKSTKFPSHRQHFMSF